MVSQNEVEVIGKNVEIFILLIIGMVLFFWLVFTINAIVPRHYIEKFGGYICTTDKDWGFTKVKTDCFIIKSSQ